MEGGVYEQLKQAWLDEHYAPELLPYAFELIARIAGDVEEQQEEVEESLDGKCDEKERFSNNLLLMGLDRVKFLLSSYLRARMAKIEAYFEDVLSSPVYRGRLSPKELEYAQKYKQLLTGHFNSVILSKLPQEYQATSDPEMVVKPNLQQHVICRVKDSIGEVQVDAGNPPAYLEEDDVVVIRYQPIRGLFLEKRMEMV